MAPDEEFDPFFGEIDQDAWNTTSPSRSDVEGDTDEEVPLEAYADDEYSSYDDYGFEPDYPQADHEVAELTEKMVAGDLSKSRGKSKPKGPMGDVVLEVLRKIVAYYHGREPGLLIEMLDYVGSSEVVLEQLDSKSRKTWDTIFQMLRSEAGQLVGQDMNMGFIPSLTLYKPEVHQEFAEVRDHVATSEGVTFIPHTAWTMLIEQANRLKARGLAQLLINHIDSKEAGSDIVETWRELTETPPAATKLESLIRPVRTAREVWEDAEADGFGTLRISSGIPQLDLAFTNSGEMRGAWGLGEGHVFMGLQGTGKSSFTYGMLGAALLDLQNLGLNHAKVVFAHTEEESKDKLRAADIMDDPRYSAVLDNLIVDMVNTSRIRLCEIIYDIVDKAEKQAIATGMSITQFLPYLFILDYHQSIQEVGESETEATRRTSMFLTKGVQAWDPREMSKWGGLSYQEHTGRPWPKGMESHRVAGVYFAQLTKQNEGELFYRKNARNVSLSDFALEVEADYPGAWEGPDGNFYSWKVKEGSLKIMRQGAIRGHGQILQDATTVSFLHRLFPRNNPRIETGPRAGHLMNTEAYIVFDKTRTGISLPYATLEFDLGPGNRTRWYDRKAEAAIQMGKLKHAANSAVSPGDPITPVRPVIQKIGTARYRLEPWSLAAI